MSRENNMDNKQFKLPEEIKIPMDFKIPEGYFDQLEDRVMAKIAASEKPVIRMNQYRNWWYAAAAVVVLALGIGLIWKNSVIEKTENVDLEHYLAYHTSLNQYDLMTMLDEEDIKQLNQDLPVENEAIEDYLSNETETENLYID